MLIKNRILLNVVVLSSLFFQYGCNNSSSEPEPLFEFSNRFSSSFTLPPNIRTIIIANSIGFINVTGSSDSSNVTYLLDKTVKVTDSKIGDEEFQKMNLDYTQLSDSLFISVSSSSNNNYFHKGSLNLTIPFNKKVIVRTPNDGVYLSYLDSDIKINTTSHPITVFNHNGSLELYSVEGNITATFALPANSSCKIYTESGSISAKIPTSTLTEVKLKTATGSIKYSNLNFSLTFNSAIEINGKLGNGDSMIDLFSRNGNILLEGF